MVTVLECLCALNVTSYERLRICVIVFIYHVYKLIVMKVQIIFTFVFNPCYLGKERRQQKITFNMLANHKLPHPFFHDGRTPMSPIDHPKNMEFSFNQNQTPSPNREMEIISNTFYYHPKSPSFEEDSGSTSGIHTIDEEVQSVQFENNVV